MQIEMLNANYHKINVNATKIFFFMFVLFVAVVMLSFTSLFFYDIRYDIE